LKGEKPWKQCIEDASSHYCHAVTLNKQQGSIMKLTENTIFITESMTGHLLGAAGAVEAIVCVKVIQNNVVPPTINTESIDPEVPSNTDLTLGKERTRPINIAMSNTFGFGGHNAIAVFSKIIQC
jgi:3-oxoacyl-(acyl-carrier-protein) synthase